MAAPPGDDPRIYSPSKLTALPTTYLTPSNDSLNNSGTYAQAIPGPIIASGHGQPARRDGQAFWDDTAPTPHPILISSDNPPAAGRSPQDSQMGSPESEEITLPAILTTQIGPNTQAALLQALPSASTSDSQQLWANVPSFPADLPLQPEEIEVIGRASPTSNKTPRARSRARSDASVWSHATVESSVSDIAQPSIPNPPSSANLTFKWHNLAAAIRAGLLSDPMDPNAISMSGYDPDGDEDEFLLDLNKTLADEIKQDVSSVLQGWSTYVLRGPIELRKGHELPTTKNEFNCMVNCVLTALDAGASSHDGETMVKAVTPQSWMRLTLAILAAILRGALRSPASLRSGSRLLSGVDSFPLHKDLDHPLTEGGAILLMCQQLGGLYRSNRNHPDKSYPDSYFDRLTTLLDSRMHQVPEAAAPPAPAPLTEADRAQVTAATRERLILEGLETARVDQTFMNEIKEAVKAEIYANLNAEALDNAEEWRALYKHEFIEAMHSAFEAQYPGIHPNKGKARAMPPLTHSQVVRDAQPRIQQEVKLQVEARIADIHNEIKDSLATNDPFWKEGPLRESIEHDIRTRTEEQVRKNLEEDIQALKVTAQDELDALKAQVQYEYDTAHKELHAQAKREYEEAKSLFATNLEKDVEEFKETIKANVKDWKKSYRDARSLTALRREARRFGCNVVPADEGSGAAEKELFKQFALTPLTVDGRDLSAEPPTPQDTPFSTPPNLPNSLPDPNVTPTQTRTKRHRAEEPAVYPPLSDALFLPVTTPTQTPLAASIPLPTPMDEDLDYALEVHTECLHHTGGSIHVSIHASPSDTNHPSRVHNPSAPPQGASLDAQSERQPTAPIPAALKETRPTLEVPVSAHQTQPADPLATILAAINATITGLEGRLADRLDAQDKRIEALSLLTLPTQPQPAVKGTQAKGKGAVAAPPRPNTSSAPSGTGKAPGPVPRADDPVPQDRPEEIVTPGAATATARPTTSQPTVLWEAFQPPPEKVVHLNVDSRGKPTPATSMPPSWANITKAGFRQQQQGAAQATAVTGGTYRSNAGKARPETVQRRAQSGNTEATVIRYHGIDDPAFEATIRKMTPSSIISQTRDEVDRLTGGRVTLLSGRWSTNKKLHNFVYTFKGQLPFKAIYPLRDVLVKLLITGHLVPNDGWTFAQIRDTTTSDASGTIFSGSQLEEELRRNPAFEDVIFCVAPHWQGSIHKVSQSPRGTVKFAYVDENGQATARAKRDGVFLFNERTRFVPTGDVATIKVCGRCHRIGHSTDSAACPLPANAVRCFICGGAHHSNDHATHCPRPHDKVGECRCLFPCINCRGGHNARSPHCKLKLGFTPPPLAPRPETTTAPAAPPPPSAKGKERERPTTTAPAEEVLVPTQREEAPFTTVTRKMGRKAKQTAKAQAAKTAHNATVPGSSSFTDTPLPPSKGKITAIVPARPAYKGRSYPKPPTWKEAPVITARHVATDAECASVLEQLFKRTPTTKDLRSLHVAWGGHESDEEVTALWTLHFKWAVKYGLPLTVADTIDRITGRDAENAARKLIRFEEDWGKATPRAYCLSTIPQDQYFAHPGDLEETIISPEDALQNRTMARHLVNACIRFKVLEAKANNTPPPPAITEPVIEAVLDLYSHRGMYSFFSIAKASTEDNDIWSAILDVHTTATTALLAYA
ncbi:hypothetical protein EDB86DRAFT_3087844 [Lactarius hatsudake]|nr:hypothetical protein EDB86DRAFT_3087844 [Lactarius hatsudake]